MIRAFSSPRLRRYALAKFTSLVAHNALIYAIFILVVERQESALATSTYVAASIVPSLLLSVPGGFVADALPRKLTLAATGVLRIAIVLAFVDRGLGIETVLVLTLIMWTVWQFHTPAENGALPAVIEMSDLPGANAGLQIVGLIARLAGAGFLAPVGLKVAGENFVLFTCAALIGVATFLYASVPSLTPAGHERRRGGSLWAGLGMLRSDPLALQASLLAGLVSGALLVLIVAVPEFLHERLHTSASNAVYVFSPAAGGLVLGLAIAPPLSRLLGNRTLAFLGFGIFAACLFALGNIERVATFWSDTAGVSIDALATRLSISHELVATLLTVPFGGLGFAFVSVGTRTLLYERAPAAGVGQLLAAQSALGSLLALAPTLAAGLVVGHVDIDAVLMGLSGVIMVLSIAQWILRARPAQGVPATA